MFNSEWLIRLLGGVTVKAAEAHAADLVARSESILRSKMRRSLADLNIDLDGYTKVANATVDDKRALAADLKDRIEKLVAERDLASSEADVITDALDFLYR